MTGRKMKIGSEVEKTTTRKMLLSKENTKKYLYKPMSSGAANYNMTQHMRKNKNVRKHYQKEVPKKTKKTWMERIFIPYYLTKNKHFMELRANNIGDIWGDMQYQDIVFLYEKYNKIYKKWLVTIIIILLTLFSIFISLIVLYIYYINTCVDINTSAILLMMLTLTNVYLILPTIMPLLRIRKNINIIIDIIKQKRDILLYDDEEKKGDKEDENDIDNLAKEIIKKPNHAKELYYSKKAYDKDEKVTRYIKHAIENKYPQRIHTLEEEEAAIQKIRDELGENIKDPRDVQLRLPQPPISTTNKALMMHSTAFLTASVILIAVFFQIMSDFRSLHDVILETKHVCIGTLWYQAFLTIVYLLCTIIIIVPYIRQAFSLVGSDLRIARKIATDIDIKNST